MGKIVLMQRTVDWVYKEDKNAVIRFEEMGIPEVIENELTDKYYRYD
jgi:hypothetical protein